MELTPAEHQSIFEEEWIRAEARAQIEKTQKDQEREARRVRRNKAFKIIALSGVVTAVLAVVVWRVELTAANDQLVSTMKGAQRPLVVAPASNGMNPVAWADLYHEGRRAQLDHDYRMGVSLGVRALEHATSDEMAEMAEMAADSHSLLGEQLEALNLIVAAEFCHRRLPALTSLEL